MLAGRKTFPDSNKNIVSARRLSENLLGLPITEVKNMQILVGYRGTNVGKDLLDLAVRHAKAFGGRIQLVTSLPGGEKTTKKMIVEAEEHLAEAGKFLNEQGIQHDTHLLIRNNSAGEDIVNFAAENSCDEIIIGVKSRSKVGKILFGRTAQHVILKANCPVVSVK
jgi:nucleotide-binding universal stress UspA family protein